MIIDENEELDRICINCNSFFPAETTPTEYGICLMDGTFDPHIEELLENNNYDCCMDLIEKLKFDGNREVCKDFEPVEGIEIDDGTAAKIMELKANNNLNKESLKELLFIEAVEKIDWKNHPVDSYIELLQSGKKENVRSGINSLGALIAQCNEKAFTALYEFFKKLPSALSLEDVYLKIDILEKLNRRDRREDVFDCLVGELYKSPSNNTTKKLIQKIFRIMESIPLDIKREQLGKMLKDKRFSFRLKEKMKGMLHTDYDEVR